MFHLVDQIPQLFDNESQLNALSPFGTTLHCALYGPVVIPMIMEQRDVYPQVDESTLSSTISVLLGMGADARIPFSQDSGGIVTTLYLAAFSSATQQLLDAGAVLDESTVRTILPRMDDGHKLDLGPLAHVPLESINNRDRRYVEHLLVRINPEKELAASHTTLWGQATILELEDELRDTCYHNELPVFRWHFEGRELDVDHRFQDDDTESLLHVACRVFADVVAYLIDHGVDAGALDGFGWTPMAKYFDSKLWLETRRFNKQRCMVTFQSMVDHDAPLQMLTKERDTALMCWAKFQSNQIDVLEDILRVLLNLGLDIGSRNADERNVWHLLASYNHLKLSEMLQSFVDPVALKSSIDVADVRGYTPILDAASEGSAEMLEFLIEQGCSLISVNLRGESILHLAAAGIWNGHSILQSLLTNDMHTEIPMSHLNGSTVAHHCVRAITIVDHAADTPEGVSRRFKESIAALTASSISITDANHQGKTPLDQLCQWIADEGHQSSSGCARCETCFECLEALVVHYDAGDEHLQLDATWTTILVRGLALKADPDNSSAREYPAETICSRAICLAIDRDVILNDLGAEFDHDSVFDIAVRLRQESLVLKILDAGDMDFDKPSRTEPHLTPLQSLCAHCCPASTIRMAIPRTKDVCRKDPRGLGLLHLLFFDDEAQHANMAPAIRTLLDAGVDKDGMTEHAGHTALMLAAVSRISSDAVRTLLSSGAKADVRDFEGWNALLHACHAGLESAIEELIDAGSTILHKEVKISHFIPVTKTRLCGPIQ
jgi:ankyrin repeat protein